jgi:hypothetical protein
MNSSRGPGMFLESGRAIAVKIKSLFDDEVSEPMRLAVAFWGASADYEIRGASKIICDLESGACNTEVIRALMTHPSRVVLKLAGLHAKVVVGSNGAVVSSANMSTNGLGAEGADYSGTIEAGYFVPPNSIEYRRIADWFEVVWSQATVITEDDLLTAEAKYRFRNQEMPTYLATDDIENSVRPVIDPSEFLDEITEIDHRLRTVRRHILHKLEHALPEVKPTQQGKVMMWAFHLLLNRAGQVQSYSSRLNDPSGPATNEWILGRFGKAEKTKSKVIEQIKALMQEISKSEFISPGGRLAASQALADKSWQDCGAQSSARS